MARHMVKIAAYFMPVRDGRVFLMRRANTGWMDGMYNFPSGHVEASETPMIAVIREAKEEAGVDIRKEHLRFALVNHRLSAKESDEYVDFFFTAEKWYGDPRICETDKCDDARWFPLTALPDNIIPYLREALEFLKNGVKYTEG